MRDEDLRENGTSADSRSHAVDELLALPLDFEAFVLSHQQFFHAYAEIHCGTRSTAESIVHEVFLEIHAVWDGLLQEDELERRTLAVLHRHVTRRLAREGRDPAYIINGQIERDLRVLRGELELAESRIGLYEAISELPVRQYTVVVLRYLLGYPTSRIARFMSLDDRTVNYHCRRAKERLGRKLGLPVRTRAKQGDEGGQ
ncbi:sigma-70 family RNA polymerase sigma factor [Streptomyces sp. QL37]|uniref:sigma-70 family RNA polymerase sigma factor n=1 Tax=Streptomyces sp. QL37 TaxID=2093747 RepID=UPI000CF257BB|nr:sigma-70 family RNA polymerase sigma factor [Streptomyces sp. QL37]PPQ59439.1 sigma-70 family RNA polymerase sigma factor [Streptomyces sp. QL37]